MNKEQVIEGNKLIAEFDGYTFEPDSKLNNIKGVFRKEGKLSMLENELKYHSSWDWLMPVVEKIAFTDGPFRLVFGNCNTYTQFAGHEKIVASSPLLSTWLSVVSYIQQYNQQSK
ncbi:MAG: hypothetical protein IPJ02_17720 [Chitinophagaceae bacterium]|nr:hypothetical protein [Chitinophagaceae bacterium]